MESEGYSAIAVYMDHLSKMVHFTTYKKQVIAEEYAQLFIDTMFCLHGMLEKIISKRGPMFMRKFWTQLFKVLGTDL